MAQKKTNAMKLLEGNKVPYESYAYPANLRDAQEVAAAMDWPASQVFKTLVLPRQKPDKPMLVMIPRPTGTPPWKTRTRTP